MRAGSFSWIWAGLPLDEGPMFVEKGNASMSWYRAGESVGHSRKKGFFKPALGIWNTSEKR